MSRRFPSLLALLPAVAALALLPAARPAAAQEEPRGPGWLGLGLEEHLECRVARTGSDRARPACERRLVVARVVEDGPADRAGVRQGDTLLAVDGRAVGSPEVRERVLSALRPGRSVELVLGRSSGRAELRVVPAARPARFDAVRRMGGAPVAAPPRPAAEGRRAAEEWLAAEEWRAADGRRAAVREVLEIMTERGEVIRIRRQPSPPGRDGELFRWVELQLGPELQALQDSVFRGARAQMLLLRQLHARRLAALRSAESVARATESEIAAHPAEVEAVRTRLWGMADRGALAPFRERRMAGAEFEELEPELAEFFEVDRGLLVLRVLPGTPADRMGLRPGDVVVEAGGSAVLELEDLRRALLAEVEGPVPLKWNRKGRVHTGSLRE